MKNRILLRCLTSFCPYYLPLAGAALFQGCPFVTNRGDIEISKYLIISTQTPRERSLLTFPQKTFPHIRSVGEWGGLPVDRIDTPQNLWFCGDPDRTQMGRQSPPISRFLLRKNAWRRFAAARLCRADNPCLHFRKKHFPPSAPSANGGLTR